MLTGLVALALAVTLFVYWFDFATDMVAASGFGPWGYALLWLAFGANLLLWTVMGLARLGDDAVHAALGRTPRSRYRKGRGRSRARGRVLAAAGAPAGGAGAEAPAGGADDAVPAPGEAAGDPPPARIAVVIPAHNEEQVIGGAISSALELFDRWDIYVVSDSSGDATAGIAARAGVNVLELMKNRGKAGALEAVIEEFDLASNYDGVLILDADTTLDAGYVEGARRQLRDPDVAAVAGFVVSEWKPRERTFVGRLISAYRDRLYFMLQYLMRFGQTWRFANTSFIVPGFASVYRSEALREIDINPRGLVIEDFNMTFEVHRKRLGRISMNPDTKAYSQDPFTFADYRKQVTRWTLGFWQTVRRHKLWPSVFCFFLALYIIEVVLVSFLLLVTALTAGFVLVGTVAGEPFLGVPFAGDLFAGVTAFLPLVALAIGLFIPDYMLTCLMTAIRRRPSYLLYGLLFFPIRLVDSYLALKTIPQAWTARTDGTWTSPVRG
nr:glycosyltransferase [Nocardiopsis algeriensis]